MARINWLLFLVFSLLLGFKSEATHLIGGEITAEPVYENGTCNPLKVRFTIVAYLSSGSAINFGHGTIDFGDGTSAEGNIQKIISSSFSPDIEIARVVVEHQFNSFGTYLISYSEYARDWANNLTNSYHIPFYLESQITINEQVSCNFSPILTVPPIDRACGGLKFYHHPGAYDAEGDSLSFELVPPKKDVNSVADGYVSPASEQFYLDFQRGNEDKNAPPSFSIDPSLGIIVWDAPPASDIISESYNIAFKINEWRKVNGRWELIGFVVRDMRILVSNHCLNNPPEFNYIDRICVIAGESINEEIFAFDADNDSISVNVISNMFAMDDSPPTLDTLDHKTFRFQWDTNCGHVRNAEYQVIFRVTDYPENNGISLSRYLTLRIKVIGPPPEISHIDKETTSLNIHWLPYSCGNASKIEVWRKVDSNNFTPDHCQTGMPRHSGYKKIASLPASQNHYQDHNLIMGARFCYRLVAVYEGVNNTESQVSAEFCHDVIPAEAPVITNVSVIRTHHNSGEIDIRWMKPFDLDFLVYTGDIVYDVYRSIDDYSNFEFVHSLTNDTSYIDSGLNTEGRVYFYRLLLKVPDILGNAIVDTSAIASTVYVSATGSEGRVDLSWDADVPWSNHIQDGYHLIYRIVDENFEYIEGLTLIDSVQVTSQGFNYLDLGRYMDQPIENDRNYCYAILTRGTYGNPQIKTPLENYSQIICLQPVDTLAPEPPVFGNSGTQCEKLQCSSFEFKNQMYWSSSKRGLVFNIFYAPTTIDDFTLLATTKDTFYIDTPLKNSRMASFAGCYKIEAVDRAGNVSEFSDPFCFDNCPQYHLPNVFTPNNDLANDYFGVFRETDDHGHLGDPDRCIRFAKSVRFSVFNRWGERVYDYESDTDDGINIDWNGKNNKGVPVAIGVYYYVARVTFDVVNPKDAVKEIKGWVHVLR